MADSQAVEFRHGAETRKQRIYRLSQARMRSMQDAHGAYGIDGVTCRACRFLLRVRPHGAEGPSFLKCQKYGISQGQDTDWRAGWPACGKFEVNPAKETK